MSENAKLRLSPGGATEGHSNLTARPDTAIDTDEAQMRRALGLLSDSSRSRPEPERIESLSRPADRFPSGHRRRFVQDGDVPVTVVRRDPSGDAPGAAATGPTSNRMQRLEADLATANAARDRAEKSLSEAQDQIRDLQTKLGHADLARTEAVEAARKAEESATEARQAMHEAERLRHEAEDRAATAERNAHELADTLQEERDARQDLEKQLRQAEDARQSAERLVQELSQPPAAADIPRTRRRPADDSRSPAKASVARKPRQSSLALAEPEPVKWWLTTETKSRRR
ncbi:MAG: hypothetical protein AB7S57_25450 [Acetobacteraceae bacterium]